MKRISYLLLLFVMFGFFVSCDSDVEMLDEQEKYESFVESNRDVYYNVSIDYTKKDFEEDVKKIKTKTTELGGYTTSSSFTYGDDSGGNCTYRVPTDKLDEFLNYIESLGGVESTTINAVDITSSYDTTTEKINTLQATKNAYLARLQDANITQAEISAISSAIQNIDSQLIELQKSKNDYDDLLEYSTITIYYSDYDNSDFAFLADYGDYLWGFLLFFIQAVLYLLPIALVGFGIVGVIILIDKANKKRKNKKEQTTEKV